MDEIIIKALDLFFGCYWPRSILISEALPKIIDRAIPEEEWIRIYDFIQNKKENSRGCRGFSDRDSEGKHTCKDKCEMAKLIDFSIEGVSPMNIPKFMGGI